MRAAQHNCRLCQATSLRPIYDFSDLVMESCCTCGFVQIRDEPSAETLQDIYSQTYFAHQKYEGDWASDREKGRRMRLLAQAGVGKGARVLDAGCATGDFIVAAKDSYEMWGIDLSEEAITRAAERLPDVRERLRAGPLEQQDFPDGFFDAVVLWDVVEHLIDPVTATTALAQVVKPGGAVVLSTPNIGSWVARLMGKRWAFMTPPEHVSFFDRNTLRILLQRSGLRYARWTTSGKWTTAAFLIYKVGRVFPHLVPDFLHRGLFRWVLERLPLYVPTGDIQYALAMREE